MSTAHVAGDAIIPAMIGLLDAYSETAFADGYRRAIRDVLALQPLLALRFSQAHQNGNRDTHSIVHAFVEFIEARLNLEPPDAHLFSGGSGI